MGDECVFNDAIPTALASDILRILRSGQPPFIGFILIDGKRGREGLIPVVVVKGPFQKGYTGIPEGEIFFHSSFAERMGQAKNPQSSFFLLPPHISMPPRGCGIGQGEGKGERERGLVNFNVRHTRERTNGSPLRPLPPSLPKVEGRGGTEGKRFAPSFFPPTSNKIRALFFPALAAAAGDGRFPLFRTYSFPHFSPYVQYTRRLPTHLRTITHSTVSSPPPPNLIRLRFLPTPWPACVPLPCTRGNWCDVSSTIWNMYRVLYPSYR